MFGSAWDGLVYWVRQESAAATALVEAVLALGIAFGWWHWSDAQTGAVIGIVSALLCMFVRSQVTPLPHTRPPRRVRAAAAAGAGPADPPPPEPGPGPSTEPYGEPPAWPYSGSPGEPPADPGTRPL